MECFSKRSSLTTSAGSELKVTRVSNGLNKERFHTIPSRSCKAHVYIYIMCIYHVTSCVTLCNVEKAPVTSRGKRCGARYFAGEEPLTPDRVRWASKARPRAGELVKSQNSKPFFFYKKSHPSATAISYRCYRVNPSNKVPLGNFGCHPLSSMSGLKNSTQRPWWPSLDGRWPSLRAFCRNFPPRPRHADVLP